MIVPSSPDVLSSSGPHLGQGTLVLLKCVVETVAILQHLAVKNLCYWTPANGMIPEGMSRDVGPEQGEGGEEGWVAHGTEVAVGH